MKYSRILKFTDYPRYITDYLLIPFYKFFWRRNGTSIGNRVNFLGKPIIKLVTGSNISIGNECLLCSRSLQTALGVGHQIILRTLNKEAKLIIGNGVRMSGTTICAAKFVKIGDRCVVGADVIIADTDFHSLNAELRSSKDDSLNAKFEPINIGNDVFIGGRSIILKGVKLGDKVIVGAGSVVTKSFGDNSIIGGNPAKFIGYSTN
jgi:acetyltransferase-like isoleucine patch superfamily enzyme